MDGIGHFDTSFAWEYGWKHRPAYKALSEEEQLQFQKYPPLTLLPRQYPGLADINSALTALDYSHRLALLTEVLV